jgi:hypothetical protein
MAASVTATDPDFIMPETSPAGKLTDLPPWPNALHPWSVSYHLMAASCFKLPGHKLAAILGSSVFTPKCFHAMHGGAVL